MQLNKRFPRKGVRSDYEILHREVCVSWTQRVGGMRLTCGVTCVMGSKDGNLSSIQRYILCRLQEDEMVYKDDHGFLQ